jgi:hypothetical protein
MGRTQPPASGIICGLDLGAVVRALAGWLRGLRASTLGAILVAARADSELPLSGVAYFPQGREKLPHCRLLA